MKKLLMMLMLSVMTFAVASADEPTVVFAEGFSAFTEGSEDAPAETDISTPTYSCKLRTTLTGWSGKYVYEAGGMLKIADGGNIKTNYYDMSANSGIVKISCRVRSLSDYGMVLKVTLGYSTSRQVIINDNNWHDVDFIVSGGNSRSTVTVEPSLSVNGLLIDSLSVTQSTEYFPAPVANQPSVADGERFVASWGRVTGTTAYLLDVYTKKSDSEYEYVLQNDTVNTTSKTVSGLDKAKTYFYRVRATNGTATSDYSNEIEVVKVVSSIEAPVALPATDIEATSFTANWNAVDGAEQYVVDVYKAKTATAAGECEILSEDFSGVTAGSLESVEFGTLAGDLDDYTKQPGWYVENPAFAAGYLVLAPYSTTSAATLTTPALGLSKSTGAFKAVINMAEMNYGTEYSGGVVTVAVVDAAGSVLESQDVTLEKGFKDYTVNFTKGGEGVSVKISYAGTSDKVFVNSVAINQDLQEGNEYTVFEKSLVVLDGLSRNVTVSEPLTAGSVAYCYYVRAAARTVESGDVVMIYSDNSNMIKVSLSTGVAGAVAGKAVAKAWRSGNVVTVAASEPVEVTVFNLAGAVIGSVKAGEGTTSIDVNTTELVIVKVGGKAFKL